MQKALLCACFLLGASILCAQATFPSDHGRGVRQRAIEDQIIQKIDAMRKAKGLPRLIRVSPTEEEIQLTCTAAVTDKKAFEPKFGNFLVFKTGDLQPEDESLKEIALGTAQDLNARNGARYDLGWKSLRHVSAVVYSLPGSDSESSKYFIGLARHASKLAESFAWISFDHPLQDSRDWRKQIDSACRIER